ncbi:SDR family oxidoreductase [Chiayiivirga flava]|uniref:NAD(P)-dependent dehydrogenase (Short-subunit alcohol dehydrogenase family) n=1 Tax=Chiayiivirga flava TaxID=659595 RepID=A0A7W8D2T7_9GAMM|nr:SDR family oxidoreductase [Chiayiivirga flava]MBB5206876.1 NAD(P)-dependent dehydrogenase (short-subunit alcohol dehydrogenase family) [Chiayiivirga flava]
MHTALITGCSSGYGLATARHFLAQGWSVVATMRRPRKDLFPASDRLRVVALDVTDADSIAHALHAAGPVDVLVNNAGVGLFGAFEATPMATVREIFDTNTFGTMAMCRAVIPQFRARGAGTIVNVTSSATLAPFPLVAAYTASKSAIEGFTGSLALELAEFGVRARLVEPGYCPDTRFADNGAERMRGLVTQPYGPFAERIFDGYRQLDAVTHPDDVARAVWQAATDTSARLRFAAGADAVALARAQ